MIEGWWTCVQPRVEALLGFSLIHNGTVIDRLFWTNRWAKKKKRNIDGGIDLAGLGSDRKGEVIYHRGAVLCVESGRCINNLLSSNPFVDFRSAHGLRALWLKAANIPHIDFCPLFNRNSLISHSDTRKQRWPKTHRVFMLNCIRI